MINRNNISPAFESGLVITIAVILGLISIYLPIIGAMVDFFWAVPFTVLSIRSGIKKAALTLCATIILLSFLVGSILTIRLALSFGLAGLALGFAIQNHFGAVKTFMLTLMVSFAAQVLATMILLFAMNVNILDNQIQMVRESFAETFALYESLGVSEMEIEQAKSQIEPAISAMSLLMPTFLLLMALINTAACFYTVKWLLPKIGLQISDFPRFSEWRFPIAFFYLMILSLLGLYWGSTRDLTLLYTVSINANIMALFVGFIQGLAVLSSVADHYEISKLVRRLLFVVLILNFMMFQIVSFVGLFDMYFDYRRYFR